VDLQRDQLLPADTQEPAHCRIGCRLQSHEQSGSLRYLGNPRVRRPLSHLSGHSYGYPQMLHCLPNADRPQICALTTADPLWPELMIGLNHCHEGVDMSAVRGIVGELYGGKRFFVGRSTLDQMEASSHSLGRRPRPTSGRCKTNSERQ
jgi:hypothetical protein